MLVDNPQGSEELYERVRDLLGDGGPPSGALHLAGPGPDGGWRVIELWESEAAARRFFEKRLLPAVEAVGTSGLPAPRVLARPPLRGLTTCRFFTQLRSSSGG